MALPSIDRIDELFHRPRGDDDTVRYNVVSAALERVRRDLE